MANVLVETKMSGVPAVDIPHVSPLRKGQVFEIAGSWVAPHFGVQYELYSVVITNTGAAQTQLDVYFGSAGSSPGQSETPNNPVTDGVCKRVDNGVVVSNPRFIMSHYPIANPSATKFDENKIRFGYLFLNPGEAVTLSPVSFYLKNNNNHMYIWDYLNQSAGIEVKARWVEVL